MNIAIVILAAGLSKRMGAFKPLLAVGSEPAIMRVISTAASAGIRDKIVVTGYMRDELERVIRAGAPEARLIYNNMYKKDMLFSVRAGVAALPEGADGFFLLPADCCAVSKDTFAALIEAFDKNDKAAVTRPVFNGARGHPPLIPARQINRILTVDSDNGLKGILDDQPSIDLETNDPGVLMDMDTPEDYQAMLKYVDGV